MAEPLSPLQPAWRPGRHGNLSGGAGVVLSETRPGSIVQVAAWPGSERAVIDAIRDTTGISVPDGAGGGVVGQGKSAFGIAPGRFLVIDQAEGLEAELRSRIDAETGSVTGLSHGRTAIRIDGPKAEWVLSKLFAVDFSLTALPVGSGIATQHHDVLTQIQRTGAMRFDLYVFRSLARSFWKLLCHSAEDVGYEVI